MINLTFSLTWKNGFILIIPLIVWNLIFTNMLPLHIYFKESENPFILIPENVLRIIVFFLPIFIMINRTDNNYFDLGIILYFIGIIFYFMSWLFLLYVDPKVILNYPKVLLYLIIFAPAYTPIIIFLGIALICIFPLYIIPSTAFIILHMLEYITTLSI